MPKPYPAEFRSRAVLLVKAGRRVADVAYNLGISAGGLSNWVRQDRVDRGELRGRSTTESVELRAARERIRELEEEMAIVEVAPKRFGVSKSGYSRYKHCAMSPTKMRRQWLTGLIQEVHTASRGTHGYCRVYAGLT